jgi:hypothetical protein
LLLHGYIACLTLNVLCRSIRKGREKTAEKDRTIRCFFTGLGLTPLMPALALMIATGADFS